MEGGPWRTRLTLSDLLAVQHSSNLRDLLGFQEVEEEEDGGHHALLRRRGETLTLASALAYETGEASSTPAAAAGGRTLLDIFRDDESLVAAGAGDNLTWTAFEEHVRLSAALAASSSRDPPATNGGAPTEEGLAEDSADGGDDAAIPAAAAAAEDQQPVRVSLMALLEATEGQMGDGGEVWAVAEEEGEEIAGGEEEEEERCHVCCVCAERRKGAAFIPCGHTFCRVCSRVLFKRRGSCPLCNAHIVQVLRIF